MSTHLRCLRCAFLFATVWYLVSGMLVTIRGQEKVQPAGLPTFFAGGFRPFFLLGSIYGACTLFTWLGVHAGLVGLGGRWPAWWWHGHEMVFGFAAAAVAGFLLTAVPKWTKSAAPHGGPLALLVLAWTLGRVAAWTSGLLPEWALMAADQLFLLPILAWLSVRVASARNRRNYVVPVIVAGLALADLAFHAQISGWFTAPRPFGLHAAVYMAVVLMTLISGRIVPSFTASALRRRNEDLEVVTRPVVGRIAVACVALTAGIDLAAGGSLAIGAAALVSAVLLVARSTAWRFTHSLGDPLVWILHLGHAWLVIGFALLAAWHLVGVGSTSSALHAFTAGAIGTLVIGVTTRASLGHSGRELRVSGGVVVIYVLVCLGAIGRVAATFLPPGDGLPLIVGSGISWAIGFAGFALLYWPVLTRPRIDGRPG